LIGFFGCGTYQVATKKPELNLAKAMIIPVKCFTCGKVLADKYRYYLEEVRRHKGAGKDTQPKYMTSQQQEKTAEGHVLDKLGLLDNCCRTRMLTHKDIIM